MLPLLVVVALVASTRGQDFSIPSGWRKPTSSRSRPERLSIAQTAITSLISAANTSDGSTIPAMDIWAHAHVPAGLAQHDYITLSQDNHAKVSSIIAGFRNTHDPSYFDHTRPLQDATSAALIWGLAAFYGARAYNDSGLLDVAVSVWNVAQAYSVSIEDGAAGTQRTRNARFTIYCVPNVTSAGAVFWVANDPSNFGVNGETVGAYVALSAHLWESTGNTTYLNAAEQSASFMYTHMYHPSMNLMTDTYQLSDCSDNNMILAYNQGFFLEGLSILSSAPVSENATWEDLLQMLVVSAVHATQWTFTDGSNAGVFTSENPQDSPTQFLDIWLYRNIFTRALCEIWSRTSPSSPMADLIQAFFMVQYNALLDLASNNGDFYSPVWTGPTLQTPVPWGQVSALGVLDAAINMPPSNASATSSLPIRSSMTPTATSRTPSAPPHTSRMLSGGAIAGITMGAIAGIVALLIGAVLLNRRSQRRLRMKDDNPGEVDPFPPGLPTIQQRQDTPFPRYINKNRSGYGFGPSESSRSTSAAARSRRTATTATLATNRPAAPLEDAVSPFAELTRAIRQLRMQLREPPPSYYTG